MLDRLKSVKIPPAGGCRREGRDLLRVSAIRGDEHRKRWRLSLHKRTVTHITSCDDARVRFIHTGRGCTLQRTYHVQISLKIGTAATSVTVEANGGDLVENDPSFHTDVDTNLTDRMPTGEPIVFGEFAGERCDAGRGGRLERPVSRTRDHARIRSR